MKKEIEIWLSNHENIALIELSQHEEFINFLLSFASANRQKAVSDTHKCAVAIKNIDKGSFAGCLAERFNNPKAEY